MKNIRLLLITFALYLPNLLLPKNVFAEVDIGKTYLFGNKPVNEIFNSLSSFLNMLLPNIFIIAGIIFLILLIFAGFGVIVSAGSGNPDGAKKAKDAATQAATGLFLIFGAYWIIQIIQFITGVKIFNSLL